MTDLEHYTDTFDLGSHTRAVTTSSVEAQRWFDLGLNWCFGFNHEEGVSCFRRAVKCDPDFAMAYWGMAYGLGPFYNRPWRHLRKKEADKTAKECFSAITQALALTDHCSEEEAALIRATSRRYQADHMISYEEFDAWASQPGMWVQSITTGEPDDTQVEVAVASLLAALEPDQVADLVRRHEP